MIIKEVPLRSIWVLVAGMLIAAVSVATASDEGHAAADQVTEESYRYFLGDNQGTEGILYTHDGDDREFGPEHDLARANIVAECESYGLSVALEPFYYGELYYNVVATKLGTVYPDQEWIVGAHFDSASWFGPAPGADDDASGVATVLEAARIISQYDSDYTIRFICFDREEQGLIGSSAYVDDHFGDDILGMVQCDMMAWDPATNNASIWGHDNPALPLKTALAQAISDYSEYKGVFLTPIDRGWNGQSDHAPFDAAGYQACMFIEGEGFNNNTIHSSDDSVDNPGYINYPYAVRMTKSVVGWLVDAAGVQVPIDTLDFIYSDGRPELIAPHGGTRMRVEVVGVGDEIPQPGTGMLHYDVGDGWESVPMEVVSDNVYDAVFPAADCGQEVLYYVSAEAVGGEVFTDPRNAPDTSYSATAAYGRVVAFEDSFDTNPGWTTEGQWAFGQPTGGGGEYGGPDPTSGYTGPNVYGYNLNGDYPNNLPERHLTSTAVDCTDLYGVHLKFWRWLGVEQAVYDHAYVRVSNNGANWTTVWQNAGEIADYAWVEMDLDISGVADGQPTVYLRWTMGSTDGGWRYCGWNIDDIELTALDCEPPCVGDLDGDQDTDQADLGILLADWGCSGGDCPGDIDGDGSTGQSDLGILLADWGCGM